MFAVGQRSRGDWGTTLAREDGSPAVIVGADSTADDAQMVRLFAREGAALVMDDPHADDYLGRPSLPIPWQPTPGWITASRNGAVCWYAATLVQCPVMYLHTETYAPPRATAVVTLECSTGDGWRECETWTAEGGDDGGWTSQHVNRPMHGIPHMTHTTWRLRHHISKGAGSCTTHVVGAYQRGTTNADETPKRKIDADQGGGEGERQ